MKFIKHNLYKFYRGIDYLPLPDSSGTLMTYMLPGMVTLLHGESALWQLCGLLWMFLLTITMMQYRLGKLDPKDEE